MKIKDIDIKRLYGRFDFHINLDEKVNVIAGINGSFKTTLLRIIYDIIISSNCRCQVDDVIISLSNGYAFSHTQYFSEASKTICFMYNIQKDGIQVQSTYGDQVRRDGLIEYLSTFDVVRETKLDQSQLDAQLKELQSNYGYYLSDLAKRITDYINKNGNISKEQMDKINYSKDLFLTIINDSFSGTGKSIIKDESKLTFAIGDDRIFADALSAGEKQLLIIMLKILLTDNKECVIIMDEPEISLHLGWQYNLIDNMLKLNPNAQFIITTHSPGIFGNGWGDKIIYLDKLKVDNGAVGTKRQVL